MKTNLFKKIIMLFIDGALAIGIGTGILLSDKGTALETKATVGNDVTIAGETFTSAYETGFESCGTGTNYQGTQTYDSSKANGASWSVYYGTVSTSSKITGSNSMHMRLYSNKNAAHAEMTSNISNVSALSFNYAVSNKSVRFDVQYSSDNGTNWNTVDSVAPTGTSTTKYEKKLSSTIEKFRLRVLVTGGFPSSSNYTFRIDDIILGSKSGGTPDPEPEPTKALASISIEGTPTLSYTAGQQFNVSGLSAKGTYDDDSEEPLTSAQFTCNPSIISGDTTKVTVSTTVSKVTGSKDFNVNVTKGTKTNPFNITEAISAINGANNSAFTAAVTGIVCQVDKYNETYKSITYWISADGNSSGTNFEIYGGLLSEKDSGGDQFNSINDIAVGDTVIVYGSLKKFNSTYEADQNNYIVSLEKPVQKTITGLEISGTPDKTEYFAGDPFDPTGLTVTATYSDETEGELTFGFEWEIDYGKDNESLVAGMTSVDVMVYIGDEVMSDVETISGLTVLPAPTYASMAYPGGGTSTNCTGSGNEASTFGLDENIWNIEAKKGSSSNNVGLNRAGYFALYYHASGSNEIVISVKNFGMTIEKLVFEFNNNNSNVKVLVSNEVITATSDGVYNIDSASAVTITNGNTSNIQVQIKELKIYYTPAPELSSELELSGDYQTEFEVGDTFNHDNMTVTANYEESTLTQDVTEKVTFSGYDLNVDITEDVTQKVTVTYTNELGETATAQYDITVKALAFKYTAIVIATTPTKSSYYVGEKFSSKGLVVKASKNNGDNSDVDDVTSLVTLSVEEGTEFTTANESLTITITYSSDNLVKTVSGEDLTATFTVSVKVDTVTSLSWTNRGDFSKIAVGEKLSEIRLGEGKSINDWTFKPSWESGKPVTQAPEFGTGVNDVHLGLYSKGGKPDSENTALSLDYVFTKEDDGKYLIACYKGAYSTATQIDVHNWRNVTGGTITSDVVTPDFTGVNANGPITTFNCSDNGTGTHVSEITKVSKKDIDNVSYAQVGNSSNMGRVTVTATKSITKVKVVAAQYASDENKMCIVYGDNKDTVTNLTSVFTEYSITIPAESNIKSVSIEKVDANKTRFVIASIEVECGSIGEIGKTDNCLLLEDFIDDNMHMQDPDYEGKGTGLCSTSGAYSKAKEAFADLTPEQQALFMENSAYTAERARLVDWAKYHHEQISYNEESGTFEVTKMSGFGGIVDLNLLFGQDGSNDSMATIVAVIVVSAISTVAYLAYRKKKRA